MLRITLLGIVVWQGLVASPALADPPPPQGISGVSQYVELVPTGRGDIAPEVQQGTPTPLAPAAESAIRTTGGPAAEDVVEIATSTRYGAPIPAAGGAGSGSRDARIERDEAPATGVSAGAGALLRALDPGEGDDESWRLVVLAGVLFGTTGWLLGLAGRRRRRT